MYVLGFGVQAAQLVKVLWFRRVAWPLFLPVGGAGHRGVAQGFRGYVCHCVLKFTQRYLSGLYD